MGTRYLDKNEQLLNSYTVRGVGPGQRGYMEPLHKQKPNTRFLWSGGPAHRVGLYQFGRKNILFKYDSIKIAAKKETLIAKFDTKLSKNNRPDKEKRLLTRKQRKIDKKDRVLIEGNQFMRWGEEVVIYDSMKTLETIRAMRNFLNSRGFYANKIKYETRLNGKENKIVNLTYLIDKGPAYIIDSIEYEIPDWRVRELIMSFNENFTLKKGQPLKQDNLSAERDRIYNLMVNRGYYQFSKDQVHFQIDSVTLGNNRLIVKEVIDSPKDKYYHKKYVLDSVIFVTDAGGSQTQNIPNEVFNRVTYNYGRFRYSPKILDWHNHIYPGKIYQRNSVVETQRQLSYVDNFKFINVNFDTLNNKLIAHVFMSPADNYSTSTEAGFSVTQGLPGPFASLQIKNRNLFRGLEITEFNGYLKLEGNPGITDSKATYSSVQYGGSVSVTLPQFLTPLGRFYKKRIAQYNPRTRFGLSFDREDRLNNYERSIVTLNASYIWKEEDHVSWTVSPAVISYISSNLNPGFKQELINEASPSFVSTFQPSFVSSGVAQLIINDNYGNSGDSDYLQFSLEFGGHLLSLFGQKPFGSGLEYFNYTRANIDLRRLHEIHSKLSVAMRLNVGMAFSYGLNRAVPYEKYFFGGGSNSQRAWRPRRLGPGAFGQINDDGSVNYNREQPGDLLIESSFELRQKLYGFIDGAFFVDAGNVWNINSQLVNADEDPEGDNGIFDPETFLSEIAVGSGLGIRFDLSFLIFRLDLGWKLVDPAKPVGKRWVGSRIFPKPFSNATYNIGIGYPF